jgi:bifunctional non-homologous end joining protein LigD
MECTAVDAVPDDPQKWMYEVKLDGYRCCAVVAGRSTMLYSRYGNPWPDRFQKIRASLADLGRSMVLDGEIVAVDAEGRPSFQELQNWQSTRHHIVYYVFDITSLDGRDLRPAPIEERKNILSSLALEDPVRLSETLEARLRTLVPRMKKLGLEGIVAKRRGSRYESGRRSTKWLKHRFNEVGEFVIGGYIPDGDSFSHLLIGSWRGNDLVFIKKLRNGFGRTSRNEVMKAIRRLRRKTSPFVAIDDPDITGSAVWVKPEQKAEVEFVERTRSGNLRHPFFRRLV